MATQSQPGDIGAGTFDPISLGDTAAPIDTPSFELETTSPDLTPAQAVQTSEIAALASPAPSGEVPFLETPVQEGVPGAPTGLTVDTAPDLEDVPAIAEPPLDAPAAPGFLPTTALGTTTAVAATTVAAATVVPAATGGIFSRMMGWVKGLIKMIAGLFTTATLNPNLQKWIVWGVIALVTLFLLQWLSCAICKISGGCGTKEGFCGCKRSNLTPGGKAYQQTNQYPLKKKIRPVGKCANVAASYRTHCHSDSGIPWVTQTVGIGDGITKEGFVPWNSEKVGKHSISMARFGQAKLNKAFKSIISDDKGKIPTGNLTRFRNTPHSREQAKLHIDHVLNRINLKTDRKFHILDIQALSKDTAVDPTDGRIVDKYTCELFVQEKDYRNVHASAIDIRVVFLVTKGVMQIETLHFITDYFYQRPLVDGKDASKPDLFRIKNPFHLVQPFFTSEDKVLPNDGAGQEILRNHHRDLRSPQYRCFDEHGAEQLVKDGISGRGLGSHKYLCDTSGGYWDTPVKRDDECPFFRANKNYTNRLGGVDINSNRCEVPINTKRIGYRFISNDPVNKPWAYNCHIGADGSPGSWGPCADEQRDKSLYPNLVNPDIAYPGDELERYQHRHELAERGLNWQKHPTKIRDVTNPNQKQPVHNFFVGPGPGKIDP